MKHYVQLFKLIVVWCKGGLGVPPLDKLMFLLQCTVTCNTHFQLYQIYTHTSLLFLESVSPPAPTDSNSEAAAIASSTTLLQYGSVDIPNNAHQQHVVVIFPWRMVKGRFPYRRTVQFLSQGRLYFKNSVKCISINYDAVGKRSEGMR